MAYNGSGTFELVAGNPVVSGTTISSTTHNNTMSDIATGLTNCVTRDGQSPATANLPMGGFKLTGLAAGTVEGDAIALGANGIAKQIAFQSGYTTTATAAGTTNLLVDSNQVQYFTGSTTQTVTLPVASTLTVGHKFLIVNSSSGVVTVNSSGGNLVASLDGGDSVEVVCILASGTSAASWNAIFKAQRNGDSAQTFSAATATASAHVVRLDQRSDPYIYIRDEKAAGTEGGTFTAGAWQTRTLNTEVVDTGTLASLASNQITLAAGTYRFRVTAPAYNVARHQAKLINVTDTIEYIGGGCFTEPTQNGFNQSIVQGRFTIAGSKVFEVQHYCGTTRATNGFGIASNFGVVEVYTQVEFWKEN